MRIILWNIQGARNGSMIVEEQLNSTHFDIAILTETNLIPNQPPPFPSITNNPNFKTVWSSNEQRGTGVGIILNNNNNNCQLINDPLIDEGGRFIAISVSFNHSEPLNLIALYAPAKSSQRSDWYKNFISYNFPFETIDILAGDFNMILNNNDTTSPNFSPPSYANTFISFLDSHSLNDIVPSNFKFTFSSSNSHQHFRLDRFYLRSDLNSLVERCETFQTAKSNHRMVILDLIIKRIPKSSFPLWRLNPLTAKNPSIINIINNTLKNVDLSQVPSSTQKWLKVKEECIEIYKREQERLKRESKFLEKQIQGLLNRINSFHPNNNASIENLRQHFNNNTPIQHLIDRYEELLKQKHDLLKLYAGITWDCNSETPNKFLTRRLKMRESQRLVHRIRDPKTRTIVEDQSEIEAAFHQFFSSLYENHPSKPSIHLQLLNDWKPNRALLFSQLINPISLKEVEDAIESLDPNKAPGPDGLSGWFFKLHKQQISPLLVKLYNSFLQGKESIPQQLKEGILVTLPKPNKDPLEVANRRPITLLNLDYKLYSKILNNRLKQFLPHLISKYQTGFVKGRFIIDNIITLDMILDHLNKCQSEAIITFIDFEKAFDSLDHDAIFRTLQFIGLPTSFINTIKDMLSNTNVCIHINHSLTKPIAIQRGVKQGDPISPTLFILTMECLIQTLLSNSQMKGIKLSNFSEERIKLLMFADDLVLFSENKKELDRMIQSLQKFGEATSLFVNRSKSKHLVFSSNESLYFPFHIMKEDESEKYLGFHFQKQGLKSTFSQALTDLQTLLEHWKTNFFTTLTKSMIIRCYALPKLNYLLYCERIQSPSVYKRFDKLINWFLWSKHPFFHSKQRPKVSIERLQRDWNNGGLNIPNLKIRHLAYKAWLILRAQHDDSDNIIYSRIWKQELNTHHISSPFLKDAVQALTFFKNIDPQLSFSSTTKIKHIYNIWEKQCNFSSSLTSAQKLWSDLYNVNFSHVFKTIHSLKHAPRIRNFLWLLYMRALPKGPAESLCSYCGNIETTIHLFFECPRTLKTIQVIKPLWELWSNRPFIWIPNEILPLPFFKPILNTLTGIALWTIWLVRNHHTFNNNLIPSSQITQIFTRETARFISAKWRVFVLDQSQKRHENPHTTSSCLQRNFISQFQLSSLIPYHFVILNNVAIHNSIQ
jgi:exonuclease III